LKPQLRDKCYVLFNPLFKDLRDTAIKIAGEAAKLPVMRSKRRRWREGPERRDLQSSRPPCTARSAVESWSQCKSGSAARNSKALEILHPSLHSLNRCIHLLSGMWVGL